MSAQRQARQKKPGLAEAMLGAAMAAAPVQDELAPESASLPALSGARLAGPPELPTNPRLRQSTVLQLQRRHGNAYVQRMLARRQRRKGPSSSRTRRTPAEDSSTRVYRQVETDLDLPQVDQDSQDKGGGAVGSNGQGSGSAAQSSQPLAGPKDISPAGESPIGGELKMPGDGPSPDEVGKPPDGKDLPDQEAQEGGDALGMGKLNGQGKKPPDQVGIKKPGEYTKPGIAIPKTCRATNGKGRTIKLTR